MLMMSCEGNFYWSLPRHPSLQQSELGERCVRGWKSVGRSLISRGELEDPNDQKGENLTCSPQVYCPELQYPEFNSAVADMKNSVADRNNAQSSCAGLFIMSHLGFDWPGVWLHVDMAAPAYTGERATG